MKTIVEGNENVIKILGKQVIKNTIYRKLNYILQVKCDDGVLLHNTMTGELVLLDETERSILDKLPAAPNDVPACLIEDYYLVPLDYNEKSTVEKLRVMLGRVLMPKGIKNYVIFTTTRCNARCYYCFESEYKRINMSAATGKSIAEFIISNKADGPICISWFGGEPLVGIKRIDQICRILRENGVEYSSDMTSNGYLFTEDIIEHSILEWNLRRVQITLDGTEGVYNSTKAYLSPAGSPYRRVLNNIKLLLEKGIRIVVRINITNDNIKDVEDLIYELNTLFAKYQNLYVYVHAVEKNLGFDPILRNAKEEDDLYRQQIRLTEKLFELNLAKQSIKLPSLKVISCMADNDGAVAIYPNGDLYKCQHFDEKDSIGSIYTDSRDAEIIYKYREPYKNSLCNECPIFPSCLLLNRCPGREKPNAVLCEYDIELKKRAVNLYFKTNQTKSS